MMNTRHPNYPIPAVATAVTTGMGMTMNPEIVDLYLWYVDEKDTLSIVKKLRELTPKHPEMGPTLGISEIFQLIKSVNVKIVTDEIGVKIASEISQADAEEVAREICKEGLVEIHTMGQDPRGYVNQKIYKSVPNSP